MRFTFATVKCVVDVFLPRHPFKIFRTVVLAIAVNMVDFWQRVRIWDVRFRDQPMHIPICLLSISRKFNARIATGMSAW